MPDRNTKPRVAAQEHEPEEEERDRSTDLRPIQRPEEVSEMDAADRANGEPNARDD